MSFPAFGFTSPLRSFLLTAVRRFYFLLLRALRFSQATIMMLLKMMTSK
jgi:hypothetical protein